MAIGRDGGFSTLCYSCGLAFQHSLLKILKSPHQGWGSLTMAFLGKCSYIYSSPFFLLRLSPSPSWRLGRWFEHSMS